MPDYATLTVDISNETTGGLLVKYAGRTYWVQRAFMGAGHAELKSGMMGVSITVLVAHAVELGMPIGKS